MAEHDYANIATNASGLDEDSNVVEDPGVVDNDGGQDTDGVDGSHGCTAVSSGGASAEEVRAYSEHDSSSTLTPDNTRHHISDLEASLPSSHEDIFSPLPDYPPPPRETDFGEDDDDEENPLPDPPASVIGHAPVHQPGFASRLAKTQREVPYCQDLSDDSF